MRKNEDKKRKEEDEEEKESKEFPKEIAMDFWQTRL